MLHMDADEELINVALLAALRYAALAFSLSLRPHTPLVSLYVEFGWSGPSSVVVESGSS